MAKINAYGAHEIARCHSGQAELRRLWVLTSDGRILTRFTSPATEFTLHRRHMPAPKRNDAGLREYVTALNLGNVEEV